MEKPSLGFLIRQEREKRRWTQNDLAGKVGADDITTIFRWEHDRAIPRGEHKRRLMEVFGWDSSIFIPDDQPLTGKALLEARYWNVPYPRSPYFTGRQELLERLHAVLQSKTAAILTHAVTGLGGIGKTQLAVEYAYRYSEDDEQYKAVFWAQAGSEEELFSSFSKFAQMLNLEEKHQQEQQILVEAVKKWFASHAGWLLILDNVEDVQAITNFLPQRKADHTGHIVLTTRCQAVGTVAAVPLEVESMSREEGATFLLRRVKILDVGQQLDQAEVRDREMAFSLSQMLGGLPLALDQAGAYIEETGCTLAQYIEHYQSQRAFLLGRRGRVTRQDSHPEPVTITFLLSLQKIEQANPSAADLLRFYAFLAPDDIAEDLLFRCSSALPSNLQELVSSPILFDEALAIIRRYSLVQRLARTFSLSIHRLVQAVIQEDLEEKKQHYSWELTVVLAVAQAFLPVEEKNLLEEYAPYIPHALACVAIIEKRNIDALSVGRLLALMGHYLTRLAHYKEAEILCQKSVAIYERDIDSLHPDRISALSNLAQAYEEMCLYDKAEALFEKLVVLLMKIQPVNSFSLGVTLSHLSRCYWLQGKSKQAKETGQQAMTLLEQFAESESYEYATQIAHLATIYRDRGNLQDAEHLYRRALSIFEEILPSNHQNKAYCLEACAITTYLQGKRLIEESGYQSRLSQVKLLEAEALYQKALAIFEHIWGKEHPDVASCLWHLADNYLFLSKFEQVEELNKRALAIYEKIGGPEHLEVNQPVLGLAVLYHAQGKIARAEEFYKRAISIILNSQEPEHPNLVAALGSYAELLADKGQAEDARKLAARAQALERKLLE